MSGPRGAFRLDRGDFKPGLPRQLPQPPDVLLADQRGEGLQHHAALWAFPDWKGVWHLGNIWWYAGVITWAQVENILISPLNLCVSLFAYKSLHVCQHLFMFLSWTTYLETVWLSLCSGPNIYSQSMASLSGDIETPFSLTTTGHQLLLRWSSDHGTNRRGFNIRYVGEYQSMYPAYNNILLLLMLFEWKLQKSDKNHGFKFYLVESVHQRGNNKKIRTKFSAAPVCITAVTMWPHDFITVCLGFF